MAPSTYRAPRRPDSVTNTSGRSTSCSASCVRTAGFDTLARRLKLDGPAVAAKLESVIKGGKPSESTATLDLPYTSRSKRVLELALESARAMATTDVGPEHLLAGLCAEEKNIAAMVLSEFGVGRSEVRAALNAPD